MQDLLYCNTLFIIWIIPFVAIISVAVIPDATFVLPVIFTVGAADRAMVRVVAAFNVGPVGPETKSPALTLVPKACDVTIPAQAVVPAAIICAFVPKAVGKPLFTGAKTVNFPAPSSVLRYV